MKRFLKGLLTLIKVLIKRVFCRHSYKRICTYSGHHIRTDKEVIFDIDYECVKCGKRLVVRMDEEEQIK